MNQNEPEARGRYPGKALLKALTARPALITLAAVGVIAGSAGIALAPAASAATGTCLVVDTNSDQSFTSLQDAVNAAAAGDTLFVKGTCTGTTVVRKDLTISGHSASGTMTATLNGNKQGNSVLGIDGANVTLNSLVITNGFSDEGGGILNFGGTVTLNGSAVTGNIASFGGGIANSANGVSFGTVIMNGGSTVTSNHADVDGGGIFNFCGSTLVGAVAGVNVFNNTPNNILNVGC